MLLLYTSILTLSSATIVHKQFYQNTKKLVLKPDNNNVKSIYKERYILALLIIEQLCFRSSLTMKKRYAFDIFQRVQGPIDVVLATKNACLRFSLIVKKEYALNAVEKVQSKYPSAWYLLPKILYLKLSLTVRKKYFLDYISFKIEFNYKRT